MKITIQQYIEAQEDEPVGLDLFYARLLGAKIAIEERLSCAADDNIDIEALKPEEEC